MNLYHSKAEISQTVLKVEVLKETLIYHDFKVFQSIFNLTVTVFHDMSLYENFIHMTN